MKKFICIILCIGMLTLFQTSVFASGVTGEDTDITIPIYKNGDANGDGYVNKKDAEALMQYAAGWNVAIKKSPADVTGDGKVDGMDATLLLQYLAWGSSKVTLK